MINNTVSFLLLRLGIGVSLFGHGLVRLPKLPGFSKWMTGQFAKSMLPEALVLPFSYALPIAEFAIGLLLLLGLFTRFALAAGAVTMLLLLLGTTLIEDWGAIPSQLIHLLLLAVLLSYLPLNTYAVDKAMRRK
ncbi:DoxX family membrane protein [Paraflavitalea pollutisoli]|uniref:DoxX family membrane protein n=1 Tax=Paraflavitalea pollutisoli TaxID=3034143 RepID=UPI0023ECCA1F|nr:DoxX family membrane protein [Paraflavitalea sp. H1-2-19X]